MDLWVREARLFKYGSGTGTNFSQLRGEGEPLSGGGRSSGLMSFLRIGDRAAGAIKSGGTTRRAAKMVVVDVDHPDIERFIDWKVIEEQKVAALVAGSKLCNRHLNLVIGACHSGPPEGDDRFDPRKNKELAAGDPRRPPVRDPRELRAAGRRPRASGRARHRVRGVRHQLGLARLLDRRRPELEQLGARHRRVPARGRGGRTTGT
jgi:ribonucleotide reductase alpha subunit